MILLPEIPEDKVLIEALAKEFKKAINSIFDELLNVDNFVENSGDALESAILRGDIFHTNGVFRGKFTSKTSLALRKLGATWTRNGWKIDLGRLEPKYLNAIAQANAKNNLAVQKLITRLMEVNPERVASKLDVQILYKKAIRKLNDELDNGLGRVPTVRFQFDEMQLKNIEENYTKNATLHIKNFAQDEIDYLRKKVMENVKAGVRYDSLKELIQSRYAISPTRALFIAKQETRLLTSEMKKEKYLKAGITEFKWVARNDSKVRDEHAHLNGHIFRLDNPPVIDSRTGKRGLPGQAFGCRCVMRAIIE